MPKSRRDKINYTYPKGGGILYILKKTIAISAGAIQVKEITYSGKVNHTADNLISIAKDISDTWANTNNAAVCREMGAPYGIRSPYHANAIVSRFSPRCHLGYDPQGRFQRRLHPGELPFAITFVYGYSNNHHGYIPSALGYEYTCYESGTAEDVADTLLAMLTELKG